MNVDNFRERKCTNIIFYFVLDILILYLSKVI